MTQTINAVECRFAIHLPSKPAEGTPDVHLIKEQQHITRADGSTAIVPNVRFVKNYKRPFWTTTKQYQNHVQKKEWEEVDKLNQTFTTQSELRNSVAKALGKGWSKDYLRQLSSSPFLYGSDISSTSYIKMQYMQQYPDALSGYTIATLDVETDVVHGTKDIIMLTVTFIAGDHIKLLTVVKRGFVAGLTDVAGRVETAMRHYLGDYVERLDIRSELVLCDTEIEIVQQSFAKIHEWKPDFLSIWNMDYDTPKIIEACEKAGVAPKDVFCDPSVPTELRMFKYIQGKKQRETASGKKVPINPADQWHSVLCPASFIVIDAMCVYRQIRLAEQAEPSYSLDAILGKMLGIRKLKFDVADKYIGLRWHQFMQTEYPIEYIIYNRFDCISMIELELKTKDLAFTLPSFAGCTDFSRFNSQPKKIADSMHFFLLAENHVAGTVGMTDDDAEDVDEILSRDDWIITLPAHLMTDGGMRCIEEDPNMVTNVYAMVADSDAVASYPSDISSCNVSKETTKREVISIEGIEESVFRLQNINLLSGPTNAIDYCVTMFGFPKPEEALALFNAAS